MASLAEDYNFNNGDGKKFTLHLITWLGYCADGESPFSRNEVINAVENIKDGFIGVFMNVECYVIGF